MYKYLIELQMYFVKTSFSKEVEPSLVERKNYLNRKSGETTIIENFVKYLLEFNIDINITKVTCDGEMVKIFGESDEKYDIKELKKEILTDSFEDWAYEGHPGESLVFPKRMTVFRDFPKELGVFDCRKSSNIRVSIVK